MVLDFNLYKLVMYLIVYIWKIISVPLWQSSGSKQSFNLWLLPSIWMMSSCHKFKYNWELNIAAAIYSVESEDEIS